MSPAPASENGGGRGFFLQRRYKHIDTVSGAEYTDKKSAGITRAKTYGGLMKKFAAGIGALCLIAFIGCDNSASGKTGVSTLDERPAGVYDDISGVLIAPSAGLSDTLAKIATIAGNGGGVYGYPWFGRDGRASNAQCRKLWGGDYNLKRLKRRCGNFGAFRSGFPLYHNGNRRE
jgi:hypothetical protein